MSEDKAQELVVEAEKKVKSSQGFFGGLFGGTQKLEDACELYSRAGNQFKVAKKWSLAGEAFSKNANIQLYSLGNKHEAATQLVEAANCYKKIDHQEAIKCLEGAVEIFTDMGRFSIAAKHHAAIAEIYETNILDIEKAISHYEKAADYYKGEDSNSSANKQLLKVAFHSAQHEDYAKAISIYEEVAAVSLENTLLKYSAKEYFFRAALCSMCMDMAQTESVLDKYRQMYPPFEDSREFKLLQALCEASQQHEVEAFTEAVREYDSISRLDQWYTTILLRIKRTLGEEPDLR